MISRTIFVFCLAMGSLSLSLFSSCNPPQTQPPQASADPKAALLAELKDAKVDGYFFRIEADDKQEIASLTDSAVDSTITLGSGDANVVLRYARVTDKKTNTTRTYKTEIIKKGTDVRLRVADIRTGEIVTDQNFPPGPPHQPADPVFNNLQECLADFDCRRRPALQAEANRTCKTQFAWLTCFFKDGNGVSVHLFIKPTRRICDLIGQIPDIEGLVVSP